MHSNKYKHFVLGSDATSGKTTLFGEIQILQFI